MRLLIQILPWLLGAMATPVFAQFTITTNPPLATAMVGSVYNQTLLTTGGSGNLTACQVASGTLPPSITLGTSGTSCTLSGTPTSTGSFTFEVRAFDSATPTPAQTPAKQFQITVLGQLTISTTSLPTAIVGSSYNFTPVASGGATPYTWSATGLGASGISITGTTGQMSGTVATPGTYNVSLTVSDNTSPPFTFTRSNLTLVVSNLAISTSSLPNGTVGVAYNQTLTATGGTNPYTWALASGSNPLPANLTLSSAGVITGTPAAAGGPTNVTFQVTDGAGTIVTRQIPITISPATITITTASPLPSGTVGTAYSQVLVATGGTGSYTFTLQSGSTLPAGLTLSTSGTISGNPSAAVSNATFTVVATDGASNSGNKQFQLTIAPPPLTITTSTLPNWTVSRPYNQTLTATGGTGTLTWGLATGSNPLPTGLSITPSTGAIGGTPSATGSFSFTVQVTDSASTSTTRGFSITIAAAPTITTASLPNGSVGVAYNSSVSVSNGTSPFTFAVSVGTLPAGLTLNASSGAITGSPTAAGSSTFSITATDAAGAVTAAQSYTVQIANALNVTTTSLPGGAVGTSYNATLQASGGSGTGYTWSLVNGQGNLPAGLMLSAAGAITGTPSATGTSNFTVQVTDSASATATRPLSITVTAGITITTSSLPSGTTGVAYNATLAASGGSGTGYTWTLVNGQGNLPPGLAIVGSAITGTPTAAGTSNFTVRVTDSATNTTTRPLSITISGSAVTINNPSPLPQGVVGTAYSTALVATGGSGTGYAWSVTGGTLPPNVTLSTSGLLSGNPSTGGSFSFTVTVQDSVGGSAQRAFTLFIATAALTISTASPLPNGTTGVNYSQIVQATGGSGSGFSFTITSGVLPVGLSLGTNGLLSGTPTTAGTANFTVQVTDNAGGVATKPFALTINAANLQITTASLPIALINTAYTTTLTATGGQTPYTWSIVVGLLPPGITFDFATGVLSGTATQLGTFNLRFRVQDASGLSTTADLLLQVANFSITTTSLPPGNVGQPYSAQLQTIGGTAPITFLLAGSALPAGLTLNASTGQITGTPATSGNFNLAFQARDATNVTTAIRALVLSIASNLTITSTSPLPAASIGTAYSQTLTASGGSGSYTWAVTNGALPVGLSLNGGTGRITGTPQLPAQTFNFVIQVTDTLNATAERQFTITVGSGLTITTATLPNPTPGVLYQQVLQVTGGTLPYVWSLVAGSGNLPTGITLLSNGQLTGTTSQQGTFSFTVQVADASGLTATRQYTLQIGNQLTITTASLANGTIGAAYNVPLAASGGTGTGYVWSVISGLLPAGLSLNTATGLLAGTPSGPAGTSTFTVQVADSAGNLATRQFSLIIGVANQLTITTPALPNGVVGTPYTTTTFQASGGSGTGYTWSIVSGLVPGLTLSAAGVLSGTPTTAGSYTLGIQVRDSLNATATQNYTFTVSLTTALAIDTASLPGGSVGVAYTANLVASGGSGGYVFTLAPGSGLLPAGVNLAANGAISGTPTTQGTFTFNIRVTDSQNNTAQRTYSVTIVTGISITNPDVLTAATLNVPYSVTLTAVGGVAPYTWSVTAGLPPTGLTLNPSTGVLSGTPTAQGTFQFTARAQDALAASTQKQFTLTVNATGLAITNADPLPAAPTNQPYNLTMLVSGGTAPYTWSVTQGFLPTGIVLNPTTGALTGTPTVPGTFQFTLRVQDVFGAATTRQYSLTVGAAGLNITNADPLTPASLGTAYSLQLTATGGTAPYTWQVSTGTLPPGLTLSPSGTTAGLISGTPTAAGSQTFTVRAQDATGNSTLKQFTLAVSGGGSLTITNPANLPLGAVNVPYNVQFTATGGQAPYTWSFTGQFPDGLGFILLTANLSGTPTAPGTSVVTIRVRDSLGAIFDRQFTITIGGGTGSTLSIVTTTLPNGAVGAFYTQTLQATGGMGSYQWTSEGTLPPGLGVSAGGQLFGTPTTGGTYSFNVRVTDGGGSIATRPLSLTIGGSGLTITTPTLPGASLGTPYTTTLQASGGTGQLVWTLTAGQLPPGIGLTNSTGALAGTPTVPGNYTFTVQVADTAGGRATRELTLTVNSGLTITTTALPGGSAGQAYSFTMTAAGGSGTGFVWSITAGTLPVGLTMTTGGLISGTPTTNGTSNFTVQVVDSTLQTATRQLSITIGSTLTVVTQTLPNGQLGVAYNQTVTAAGATGAVQWSVVGSLPPGLTLNAATGAIAGSPTQNGIYNFSLRVQDATLASAQRAFTIIIGDSFSITTPTALPNAIEGVAYSQALAASGGQAPYTWTLSVGVLPAGLSLTPSSGLISGTPTTVGSFSFIIQVTDATQQTVTKAFTLAIGGRLSILTPSQLPPGSVRAPYRETLSATGGIAPYNWTLLNGALPIGVTLTTGGELNGTPTNAGLFTFTAQVTDGANATATRTFTLNVALALSITTASPLPAGTAGVAYVQTVSATGGLAPYTFSLTTGALPTGLTLNSQGILAGTPTAAGSFNFTVQVSDANRGTATANMALTVRLPSPPSVLLSGLSESVEAAQQPRLSVSLGAPYPAPITGTLTLTFTSDAIVPLDDPAIVFTNGRRTVDFTIPANATSAQLPAGFAMQTGTVSGAIQLAVTNLRSGEQSIMPDPAPSITARLARGAPVVRQVVARRVASGLEVQITGYATTREITQALFRFTPAAGSTLQTTELTIQLGDGARTWYQGEQSRAFGSQFTLTQQFNVQGDTSAISSVTVTLTNAQGTSPAASANFQ